MTRMSWIAVAFITSAALCFAMMLFIGIPRELHTRAYWLLGSRGYKRKVLASQRISPDLPHAEWEGDGWGGAPVGDWMGYVVYDPQDALPITSTDRPPIKIVGIPCEEVAVRRLEKNWYSVVTDMNEFWDASHPNC